MNFGIKTKLSLALLLAGLLPMSAVGIMATIEASTALKKTAFSRLVSTRDFRRDDVGHYFSELQDNMNSLVQVTSSLLEEGILRHSAIERLRKHHVEEEMGRVRSNLALLAGLGDVQDLFERLLLHHTDTGVLPDGPYNLTSKAYQNLYDAFGKSIAKTAEELGFEKVYMISAVHGHLLYTTNREEPLGSNIAHDPLKDSPLTEAWRRVVETSQPVIIDLTSDAPLGDTPSIFVAAPSFTKSRKMLGVIVVQVDMDAINAIFHDRIGMFPRGESYLVGKWKGVSSYRSDRIVKKGKIGEEKLGTGIERAYAGETGSRITIGSTGEAELEFFTPIAAKGLQWALISTTPLEDILSPKILGGKEGYFSKSIEQHGYYDLFLIHPDGRIFSTLARESDYKANILSGSFQNTYLSLAFQRALETKSYGITDFAPYSPSGGLSSAFSAQSVLDQDGNVALVVAVQMTRNRVHKIMRRTEGANASIKTYLVGSDKLVRSDTGPSRRSLDTASVRKALAGNTGLEETTNHLGDAVLSAYAPFQSNGITWAMVAEINTEEAYMPIGRLYMDTALIAMVAAVVVVACGFLLGRSLARPVSNMTKALVHLAEGDLDTLVPAQDRKDEIGAMARAANVFKETSQRTKNLHWIKSCTTEITNIMQNSKTRDDFCNAVTGYLMPLLGGGHGAFFFFDAKTETLFFHGGYGYTPSKHIGRSFTLGEGLVGQCAQDRETIILTDLPDDYVKIGSGLGKAVPTTIVAIPIIYRHHLLGVIEIAAFQPFTEIQQALLNELTPAIALNQENLIRNIQTQELLGQARQQAEELKASETELQAINEELREKSEALERQTEELQTSEEELRSQQEELQAANEELTEKTEILEKQKALLDISRTETEALADQAGRANKYKSEFIANMSHELRTPLNSLLILAKDLAENRSGNLDEEQMESAVIVHESGEHLLTLINEILDLSKIESGKLEVFSEKVSLNALADSIKRRFKHMAEGKNISLSFEVSDKAPETIIADNERINQILDNLLANALKFTPEGEITVRIAPTSPELDLGHLGLQADKTIAFSVVDTGIGIADERKDHIFHAFEQADGTTSRKYGGTGLGLTICQRLARLLGGDIQLESHEGEGSTFTLLLPMEAPADIPCPMPTEPTNDGAPPDLTQESAPAAVPVMESIIPDDRGSLSQDDKVILVIEDDPNFAKVLYGISRKKGFKCIAVPDGGMGLQMAAQHPPIGIVLDIGLPTMDGWTVMDRLKANPQTRHIPVHFISSAADANRRGMKKGAIGYLTKPVTKKQASQAIEKIRDFATAEVRKLLVVDNDPELCENITNLINDTKTQATIVASGEEALERLRGETFDCMAIDVELPDISGFEVLERAAGNGDISMPPVVVYSSRELTEEENLNLRRFTDSIVIKGARSLERLLDEVTLFLHSVDANLSATQRQGATSSQEDSVLSDRTVLVVDDDMRSAFALSKALRAKGIKVLMAQTGERALEKLEANSDTDIVLMDTMLPDMDGLETIGHIRAQARFRDLPIISVTAMAMPEDRKKSLAAGANDYITKPIDINQLLSVMRGCLGE